jgi:hypothetical protein
VTKQHQRYIRWTITVLLCLSVPNLFILFGISAWLGGDAWYGKVEAGRYFVGSKGRLTEVTEYQYYLSLFQIYSVFVGFAGVFGATIIKQFAGLINWVRSRLSPSAP